MVCAGCAECEEFAGFGRLVKIQHLRQSGF